MQLTAGRFKAWRKSVGPNTAQASLNLAQDQLRAAKQHQDTDSDPEQELCPDDEHEHEQREPRLTAAGWAEAEQYQSVPAHEWDEEESEHNPDSLRQHCDDAEAELRAVRSKLVPACVALAKQVVVLCRSSSAPSNAEHHHRTQIQCCPRYSGRLLSWRQVS
jgi:hypothetical protein